MKCSAVTFYRNPCKNKDIGENGLCKKHTIIELNVKPKREGKCVYIRRNNKRCFQNAYSDGDDKDYCSEHSLYILFNKKNGGCKCCLELYMNIQQEKLGGFEVEISNEE
jgi:hypothetical protein